MASAHSPQSIPRLSIRSISSVNPVFSQRLHVADLFGKIAAAFTRKRLFAAESDRFASGVESVATMSTQISTHSLQINTVGPAMSFRTSSCALLQKEHRKTSGSGFRFTDMLADCLTK
jgi:hypothetical protein